MQIDEDAVRDMSDSDISEYLPTKGDRFALKDFITEVLSELKSREANLIDRLRDRLKIKGLTLQTHVLMNQNLP